MNIIERRNSTQKVFLSESNLSVTEILERHYPYLLESVRDEGIILKYDECNLFKELIFEDKVVGFCTYDFSREFITAALNNIYVLPRYRGNGIFRREILNTMAEHSKPSIMEPTRLVVELLVEYGFASKVTDSIVASALEFVIPGIHVLSNTQFDDDELSTHFYDLSIARCVHILDVRNNHVAYSSPLHYDLLHYEPDVVDEGYASKLVEFFKSNDVELMNTILSLEENLPIKNYSLEEVIGDEDNFSEYIESLIDDAHVTRSRAYQIKRQIREEYEAGMILNESLLIRLAYLFNDAPSPSNSSHDEVCPYCRMPVDSHDRFCHFCGINLEYDPDGMEDEFFRLLREPENEFEEDIRFVAYKFLRLIEEGIPFEYSVYTIEGMYNIEWSRLDDFLSKNGYIKKNSVTPEGHEFLEGHPLKFYQKYHMDIVDYTDFERYFYEHENLNPHEICLNYLKHFGDDEYILEIIDEIGKNRNFN